MSEMPSDRRRVAVLAGGDSPERAVSLVSGESVHRTLVALGCNAEFITIDNLNDLVPRLAGVDVVFSCLHGGSGENGTVQLLLDVMGIPYAGSGALASYRAMDKGETKALFLQKRVPTPAGLALGSRNSTDFWPTSASSSRFLSWRSRRDGGSTLGVHIVHDADELDHAARAIVEEFRTLLVETFIQGVSSPSASCGSTDATSRCPSSKSARPADSSTTKRSTRTASPSSSRRRRSMPRRRRLVQSAALRAHEALGCYGYSRVDVRLGEDGVPYVLEVNSLPGMTPMSDSAADRHRPPGISVSGPRRPDAGHGRQGGEEHEDHSHRPRVLLDRVERDADRHRPLRRRGAVPIPVGHRRTS